MSYLRLLFEKSEEEAEKSDNLESATSFQELNTNEQVLTVFVHKNKSKISALKSEIEKRAAMLLKKVV